MNSLRACQDSGKNITVLKNRVTGSSNGMQQTFGNLPLALTWVGSLFGRMFTMTVQQLFHLLSDSTRLRCVLLMASEGELCVCELTHALEMIQPKISRHLALLREAGLVTTRRQGQWIFYRLDRRLPSWATTIVTAALEAARDEVFHLNDLARLAAMPNRPTERCCE